MTKVLCFASAKGGSGKTTLAATIAAFLAGLDQRVLLVDADAATNGLTLLYLQEVVGLKTGSSGEGRPIGIFDPAEGDLTSLSTVMLKNGVSLVPATFQFANSEECPLEVFASRLRELIQSVGEQYDYILLDAQAGADKFASQAMKAGISDAVLIVSEYDPMSAAGIERLKALLRDDLTYPRTWILLNKVLPEFAKNFSDFLEVARYLPPIPWDAEVVRAYARRRLALDMENGNAYTLAILQVVRSLLGDEIQSAINSWMSTRADAIRQPAAEQYSDLERELAALMYNSKTVENAERRLYLLQRLALIALGFGGVAVLVGVLLSKTQVSPLERLFSLVDPVVLGFFAILLTAGATYPMVRSVIERGRSVKLELERARLERRREVIEASLRKLEVLRASDPEALINSRQMSLTIDSR